MEPEDDEFKALRSRVDKVSAELEKKYVTRAVNTRWMVAVASIIVAALGYTNFVQLPAEAAKAAKEQVGPEIVDEAEQIVEDLRAYHKEAEGYVKKIESLTEKYEIAGIYVHFTGKPYREIYHRDSEVRDWTICKEKSQPYFYVFVQKP